MGDRLLKDVGLWGDDSSSRIQVHVDSTIGFKANKVEHGTCGVETREEVVGEQTVGKVVLKTLQRDGIVILRGILPKEEVIQARERILRDLLCGVDEEYEKGLFDNVPSLLSRVDIQQKVLNVLEHPNLVDVVGKILGQKVNGMGVPTTTAAEDDEDAKSKLETSVYKWLRAVKPPLYTGLHRDVTYLGESSYLTCWIPFDEVNIDNAKGTLVWHRGSHVNGGKSTERDVTRTPTPDTSRQKDEFNIASRQKEESDETHRKKQSVQSRTTTECIEGGEDAETKTEAWNGTTSGWLTHDASEHKLIGGLDSHWTSTNFQPGDVAVFGMNLLHMTLPNMSSGLRISCDTRWRRCSEKHDCPKDDGDGEQPLRDRGRTQGVGRIQKRREHERPRERSRDRLQECFCYENKCYPRVQWKILKDLS